MRKKLNKLLAMGLAVIMTTGIVTGCSSSPNNPESKEQNSSQPESESSTNQPSSDVTLEIEVGFTGEPLDLFREVMDEFTVSTGIGIELITPGADYETVMKTRMASADMPDVFLTHGWSVARYKEYLAVLNNEEWFNRVDSSILPVISDKENNIYVLPITQGANGFIYNKTVLEKAGVNADEIHTFDQFLDACEKVKASGVTPIHIGGKDSWTTASLYNVLAPAFYTAEGCRYPNNEALKDGSFDWEKDGKYVLQEIAGMVQAGYFNVDFVTADESATITALGDNSCAFGIGGVGIIKKIKNISPDVQLGAIPVPSTTETGKSEYMIGEGSCFGIWKDSENMEEAKQFLNFLAQPEIAVKIMQVDGEMPALAGMETEANDTYQAFKDSQSAFEGNICYDNLFDREYFPSGMWSVMTDAVMEVFMDASDKGIDAAYEQLKNNYIEKYEGSQ